EAVKTPAIINDSDFEKQSRRCIHSGLRVSFLQMKEALLRRSTAIGPEKDLPREGLCSSQRMDIDKQRVIDAVEFHRLSYSRVDDTRMPDNGRGMIADLVKAIEGPDLRRLRIGRSRRGGHESKK